MYRLTTATLTAIAAASAVGAQSDSTSASDTGFTTPSSTATTGTTMTTAPAAMTTNIFLDGYPGDGYAASIMAACSDKTTLDIVCTSYDQNGPWAFSASQICGPNARHYTLTEGPSLYYVSYATETTSLGYKIDASVIESCSLVGTTEADCAVTLTGTASSAGQSSTVSIATTTKATGTDYNRFNVDITAGASKTAGAASATCSASPNAAAGGRDDMAASAALAALGVVGVIATLFA